MRTAAACALVALASTGAPLTVRAGNPVEKCSGLTNARQATCLHDLSPQSVGDAAESQRVAASRAGATSDVWIFSETSSPVDYSPVVIASATASGTPDGSGMTLSIACRGGRTSLMLTAPGGSPLSGRSTVYYTINGGTPASLAAAPTPQGTGMILAVDVVRLLASLPTKGEIAFRILGRTGENFEGRYSLADLTTARARMAGSCKWPVNPDTAQK